MSRVYDLAMTHKLDTDDFFIHRVQQGCAELGLNFFLIEPLWAESFYEHLKEGRVACRVLLNMHSEHHLPEELFHRLVALADRKGARVIDPPAIAQAAFDKSRMHARLVGAGVTVPYTVLVPAGEAGSFRLAAEQAAALGSPFVIKPSHGYGRRGVLLDAVREEDLPRSVAAWPSPCYLLQRRVRPRTIGGEPAYWRVFHVFGETWVCWWNCFTDRYREPSAEEWEGLGLERLAQLIGKVAELSGMKFFSSEIAQTEGGEDVLIDYVNDQCHMLSQSSNPAMGVPDRIVGAMAARLVKAAAGMVAEGRVGKGT